MWLIGIAFILLITKDIDKKAIIKKDKKTIPKDLKFDFKLRICLVEIIKAAKIQNWVKKIIGIIKSGVTAKNLNKPGAWAKPTAVKTFLKGTFVCFSGNSFTPITNINIAHINHVIIAVNPDIAIGVLITVLAATAPAIPSKIIIRAAKYIDASPKFLLSLYRDLSNFIDLKIISRNSPNIYFFLFCCSLYETINGKSIKAIAIIMQIAIKKPLDI